MIRLVEESNAEAVHSIYPPCVRETSITFEQSPPSVAEIRRRIRKKGNRHPWFVCVDDDTVVGYSYAGPIRDRGAYHRVGCESLPAFAGTVSESPVNSHNFSEPLGSFAVTEYSLTVFSSLHNQQYSIQIRGSYEH